MKRKKEKGKEKRSRSREFEEKTGDPNMNKKAEVRITRERGVGQVDCEEGCIICILKGGKEERKGLDEPLQDSTDPALKCLG
jgi:hypothetical protein